MTAIATETLIETEEKGAQLHHRGARRFVTSGTLETKGTSHHVILMLVEHAGTRGMGRLRQVPRSQIPPIWAPGLRIVAVELDGDEVAETLADGADPSIMTTGTDTMTPGIAH